jgi:hypothetical protein
MLRHSQDDLSKPSRATLPNAPAAMFGSMSGPKEHAIIRPYDLTVWTVLQVRLWTVLQVRLWTVLQVRLWTVLQVRLWTVMQVSREDLDK